MASSMVVVSYVTWLDKTKVLATSTRSWQFAAVLRYLFLVLCITRHKQKWGACKSSWLSTSSSVWSWRVGLVTSIVLHMNLCSKSFTLACSLCQLHHKPAADVWCVCCWASGGSKRNGALSDLTGSIIQCRCVIMFYEMSKHEVRV